MEVDMKRWIRMLPVLPFLMLFAACASNSGTGAARPDPNLLSRAQIIRYPTAFEAVQTLRSQWLRGRAPGDLDTPGGAVDVYRDGIEVGAVDELRSMSTESIAYIRYYNGIQASQRWGLGHENGVIYVSSQLALDPIR